jgi:hypothetical protein
LSVDNAPDKPNDTSDDKYDPVSELIEKREEVPSSFDFSLDSFRARPAEPVPVTVAEEKPSQDDPWNFTFGSKLKKKCKKGAVVIIEDLEPIPAPAPEHAEPAERADPWTVDALGNAVTKKKKKKKGAYDYKETPAEPDSEPTLKLTPAPEPEA